VHSIVSAAVVSASPERGAHHLKKKTRECWPTPSGIVVIRGYIQKFPGWPSGARTASGTALFH
jgi:hypothetical protein